MQFTLGDGPRSSLDEDPQQLEPFWREMNRLRIGPAVQLSALDVERKPTERKLAGQSHKNPQKFPNRARDLLPGDPPDWAQEVGAAVRAVMRPCFIPVVLVQASGPPGGISPLLPSRWHPQ